MAINLIRKNNGVGITAYQDAVLFHLAKGENGVIADVHDEFNATYNTSEKKLTIGSGMGVVYGRQFEITPGEVVEFDFSTLSGTRYIVIYIEIDLRDPTSEVATLKSTYATVTYPKIDEGDNLIKVSNGISRYALYHVLKTDIDATITSVFTIFQFNKIKYSARADIATDAELLNGVKLEYNPSIKHVEVTAPSGTPEIIERKLLVFDGENSIYNYSGEGVWLGSNVNLEQGRRSIDVSEGLYSGDILEFIINWSTHKEIVRTIVSNNRFQFTLLKNQTIGPYLVTYTFICSITNGVTITPLSSGVYLLNNPYANLSGSFDPNDQTSFHIWKIYKIKGVNI